MADLNSFSFKNQRILYCVLNWGLGHASRSIPVIKYLSDQGNDVWLASDGLAARFLANEFPDMKLIRLPAYGVKYRFSYMPINMLLSAPYVLKAMWLEKKIVEDLVINSSREIIISDHRYGCRSQRAQTNIFLAHQLNILRSDYSNCGWLSRHNQRLIGKFDFCAIPDYEDQRYSGKLSSPRHLKNYRFIGPISRLQKGNLEHRYTASIVLSGPEPARARLEKLIIDQVAGLPYTFALVRGVFGKMPPPPENVEMMPCLGTSHLNQVLNSSRMIISRSGYSSIMDIIALNKKALLIPTPGQTEQGYLGNYLADSPNIMVQRQQKLNLSKAMDSLL